MAQTITEDGEIVDANSIMKVETSMVSQLARVELDSLIATARAHPRSLTLCQRRMTDLATMDEETAAECFYSVPRDGKTVEGPSIRFAEIVAQCFGNARIAARTTAIDKADKFVEAEGVFLDCETNVATLARNRRRISTKHGKVYSDDMILTTCNASQSIARRNAIITGVPKAVWRKPLEAARRVIMGDVKTLANRRADAVAAFTRFGLTSEQVFLVLGVKGMEDIDQERLVPLRAIFAQLRNEEVTVEELLRSVGEAQAKQPMKNPLKDDEGTAATVSSVPLENINEPTQAAGAAERPQTRSEENVGIKRSANEQDAYERGQNDKRKGLPYKAPMEWRTPETSALGHAYLQGHAATSVTGDSA